MNSEKKVVIVVVSVAAVSAGVYYLYKNWSTQRQVKINPCQNNQSDTQDENPASNSDKV